MASSSKHGVKLSDAETKFLIELYQSQEVLWNSQSPEYKNQHARDNALQCIQMHFQAKFGSRLEVRVIKTKLQSFRNSFCKEFSLMKVFPRCGVGTNGFPQYKYPYFRDLLFLEPVLKRRSHLANQNGTVPGSQNGSQDSAEDEISQTALASTAMVEPEEDKGDESESSHSHASSTSATSMSTCETVWVPQEPPAVQGGPPTADTSALGSKKRPGKRKVESQEVEFLSRINPVLQRRCSETGEKPDALTVWTQNLGNEISQIRNPKKRRRLQIEITRMVQDALAEDLDSSD